MGFRSTKHREMVGPVRFNPACAISEEGIDIKFEEVQRDL